MRVGHASEPCREGGEPGLLRPGRHHQRQREADRFRALGREIRQVHAERLAGDGLGRILGKEVDARHEGIGRHDDLVARWRLKKRGVVQEPEAARPRQGCKMSGDDVELGGHHALPFSGNSPARASRASRSSTALTIEVSSRSKKARAMSTYSEMTTFTGTSGE